MDIEWKRKHHVRVMRLPAILQKSTMSIITFCGQNSSNKVQKSVNINEDKVLYR